MDLVVTVMDNGKLLKPQTLDENYKIKPYFETMERDEAGNQYAYDETKEWIYKINGFNSLQDYKESIQRTKVIHDNRTEYAPDNDPDTTLVTTTATLQLWKESSGRGSQVYALLDKEVPVDQAFIITLTENTSSGQKVEEYILYKKGLTNIPSPVSSKGEIQYSVNGSEKITVGGPEDYNGNYNIMLEEYYTDFEIEKCNLEVPYSKVFTSNGEAIEVNELYKNNFKPIHLTFDEENSHVVLTSDNDIYNISIEECLNEDGDFVYGYRGNHASIFSSYTSVSKNYKCEYPKGRSYNLLVAWKPNVDQYGLKFIKIKVYDDTETKYYYMIIDYNSKNKYKVFTTLEEAQSNL